MPPARTTLAFASLALVSLPLAVACSPTTAADSPGGGGTPSAQAGSPGAGGTPAAASGNGTGGSLLPGGGAGPVVVGGAGGAANPGGGAGGTAGDAAGGMATAGTGGLEPGDTPPWRPLDVFAAPGEHQHGNAGMDTRAPKLLGKLAVDIGVNSGGYISWLAKRGYHSIGAPCGSCPAPNLGGGRDEVGNCRMEEFATTAASVKSTLTSLHEQFPEEDWGYFLNEDGSVRWSDVAITGISHGATTSAIAGRIGARMWRIVSRAGPRDNECGNGNCTLPITSPSYDQACPDSDVASWLDQPSLTPMNRFYGIVGTTDGQCGDIMFNMHRTGYVGVPTIFNEPGAVITGTNQFFSTEGGHYDFLRAPDGVARTEEVLNIAFAIPPENQNPAF